MDVLNCTIFKELEGESDVIVEIEKEIKSTLLETRRQELISEPYYHRIRTKYCHITTRMTEYLRLGSPVEQHNGNCRGSSKAFDW